jgi:hypothetical protein
MEKGKLMMSKSFVEGKCIPITFRMKWLLVPKLVDAGCVNHFRNNCKNDHVFGGGDGGVVSFSFCVKSIVKCC